jgi:hypothetical protein
MRLFAVECRAIDRRHFCASLLCTFKKTNEFPTRTDHITTEHLMSDDFLDGIAVIEIGQ